jgi:hypothetical protein
MTTSSDEYNALRDEVLKHQERRLFVLNLALTAVVGLFVAGFQFANFVFPLLVLPIMFVARMQIATIDHAVQGISSYIRIIHESRDGELPKWETALYYARQRALNEKGRKLLRTSTISTMDLLLGMSSVAGLLLALGLEWAFPPEKIAPPLALPSNAGWLWSSAVFTSGIGIVALVWVVLWVWYYFRQIRPLVNREVEEVNAKTWKDFKKEMQSSPKNVAGSVNE